MKTRWELLPIAVAVLLSGCQTSLGGAPCPCLSGWCCWQNACRRESECHADITFVPKALDNAVFRIAYAGALEAAKKLNNGVEDSKVTVTCKSPRLLDSGDQTFSVLTALPQADGLIVSCLDPNDVNLAIKVAVDNEIPVITYDSDCPDSGRTAFYGMDNYQSGKDAADHLVKAMKAAGGPERKVVAILTGDDAADNLNARVRGFNEQLSNVYRNVQVIEPIATCSETGSDCGLKLDNLVEVHPELDGLLVTGLWGLETACTCDEGGHECDCSGQDRMSHWKSASLGKLKTLAYDSLPFERQLMRDKYLTALVSQNYRGWGFDTVNLMFAHLTRGQPATNVVSRYEIYSESNPLPSPWPEEDFGPKLTDVCATRQSE